MSGMITSNTCKSFQFNGIKYCFNYFLQTSSFFYLVPKSLENSMNYKSIIKWNYRKKMQSTKLEIK